MEHSFGVASRGAGISNSVLDEHETRNMVQMECSKTFERMCINSPVLPGIRARSVARVVVDWPPAAAECREKSNLVCPDGRNSTCFFKLVHDKDELVVMVTVERFDVDSCIGHSTCQLAQLSRYLLLEALDYDIPDFKYLESGSLKCRTRCFAVLKQEVCGSIFANYPGASTFDADSGPAEAFPHFCQCAWFVFQSDGNVLHGLRLSWIHG